MKLRTLWIILLVLLLLPFTIKLKADDFGRNQSLFTNNAENTKPQPIEVWEISDN